MLKLQGMFNPQNHGASGFPHLKNDRLLIFLKKYFILQVDKHQKIFLGGVQVYEF